VSPVPTLALIPLTGLPRIQPGDDLAALLVETIEASKVGIKRDDVVVICQKVVSKAEGRVVELATIVPSPFAARIATETAKDPRLVEVILRQTTRIVRMAAGHLICETGPGWVCANAGVDESNGIAPGVVTLLPEDADASAERLRAALAAASGTNVGVVVSDTFGRPWRDGQIDVALGVAGVGALLDWRGRLDLTGRDLQHTILAVGDQLAAAAGLLMEKDSGTAAVLVRGFEWRATSGRGCDLIRPRALDLFR
jgi:coenzyme F420-0:L-glutamate ligase/coenzyme F420-1:gamma-L-glutamate ligase